MAHIHSSGAHIFQPKHSALSDCCYRAHPEASEVYVTGDFDDWQKSVKLEKNGDIFEKTVELPLGKKILYKVWHCWHW
jgi:1,4-alpha-glucan branching enzyme